MKKRIVLCLLIAACSSVLNAQKLAVADTILNELHTKSFVLGEKLKDTLVFKVAYPHNYDSTKTYPVLLGLSGGNQSEKIVNYCYAAWFRSQYFKDFISIMPVSNPGKNLLTASQDDINQMLTTIKTNFQVTSKGWVVVGTSNGGRASFNFIAENPALFQGGLVIPGTIANNVKVNKSWSHLRFILAFGDQETKDWVKGIKMTKKALSKSVKSVNTIVLKGQGHILPIEFDLDFVYKEYFENN
jgi:poly(3-hydroxybutyrate) depolymerase